MARSRARAAAEPDLDALKDFVELPDREASPFFGGRADEIATVERAVKRIRKRTQEGHWRPAGGETVLFQGAPGAGKSALLHHFVQMWQRSGNDAPVVVDTDASYFDDERALAMHIAEAADPAVAAQFRRSETIHSSSRSDVTGGIPGVVRGGGAAESGRHTETAPSVPSLAAVKAALLDSNRVVVLILDEAQDLEGYVADEVRPVISKLHQGSHGGPILTIFAGLAHSNAVLQERGISRLSISHDRTLMALASEEAQEIVLRMLAECGVRGKNELKNQWALALANESCGWPQHLHVAMQALVAQLLAASTPGQLEPVDSEFGLAVLQASARAREKYYDRRIDAPLSVAWRLLAEAIRGIGDEASREDALAHIRKVARPGEGSMSLPEGYNAARFLDHMVRRGVVQYAPGQKLICPIPSFRDYINRLAKNPMPRA